MCEQNASHLAIEAFRIRVKKFKQILPENYSKSTKIAIAVCTFLKIFRGSMPSDLPRAFLVCHHLQISSAEKKKTLENNAKIMRLPPPPPLKILATPLSAVYQHFPNEGSKFRSKVVVKDSQDCDSIIPLHFCLLL